jgi:hypothetical protein
MLASIARQQTNIVNLDRREISACATTDFKRETIEAAKET